VLPHHSYSPDFLQADSFIFPEVKQHLANVTLTLDTFRSAWERAIRTITMHWWVRRRLLPMARAKQKVYLYWRSICWETNFFLTIFILVLCTKSRLDLNTPRTYSYLNKNTQKTNLCVYFSVL
jgi:hypothetical protein